MVFASLFAVWLLDSEGWAYRFRTLYSIEVRQTYRFEAYTKSADLEEGKAKIEKKRRDLVGSEPGSIITLRLTEALSNHYNTSSG